MTKFRYVLPGLSKKHLLLHGIFWAAFIAYEIILAETLIGRDYPLNYLLHYLLYVSLFYHHAFLLRKTVDFPRLRLPLLLGGLAAQLIIFYLLNILIATWISKIYYQDPPELFSINAVAQVAYRMLYIAGMATAFWMGQIGIEQHRKVHQMEKEELQSRYRQEQLKAEKLQAELAFLKVQIRPHFLLNVLQKIYMQARKQPEQARHSIMQLSELIQTQLIADSRLQDIPLMEEIRYIQNYIRLQGSLKTIHLDFRLDIQNFPNKEKILFPPLILSTLIENIFQHGLLSDPLQPASIELHLSERLLRLRTFNALSATQLPRHGIGMQNVRKRLTSLFPERYELQHHKDENSYQLELTIELQAYD